MSQANIKVKRQIYLNNQIKVFYSGQLAAVFKNLF